MTIHRPCWNLALSLVAAGCGGSTPSTASGDMAVTATGDLAPAPDLAGGGACAPGRNVPCTDTQISDLPLFKKASTRKVESAVDGAGFTGHVDASGGGIQPTESFVYVKFGDSGITRVGVGDEAALASMDWDLGFRRFLIRLNSGVSGPGCVTAAEVPAGTTYDQLTATPAGLDLQSEAYYDDACKLVADNSGLGSPNTVMSKFWTYPTMCVQMTNKVYVVHLADGRNLKFTVTSYYAPDAQKTCDDTGSVDPGTPGADLRFRWAVLK
jgi:hypothetical protein